MKTRKAKIRKLFTCVLSVMLVFGALVPVTTVKASAASVKIGQAACDEKGGVKGGKAGDNNGKEAAISSYTYSGSKGAYNNWEYVFRCKDKAVAAKLAQMMIDTCNNNCVGYDQKQPDRFTFYYEAQKVNWNIKAIKTNCETTCTSAISVCLNAVGIPMGKFWTVDHVYKDLKKTGKFYIITNANFTHSSKYLEPGDILLSSCHGAMVVQSPNKCGSTTKYISGSSSSTVSASTTSSPYKKGKDYQLQDEMYVRQGPAKSYSIKKYSELTADAKKYATSTDLAALNKGTVVTCIGTDGYWIQTPSGWICGKSGSDTYIVEYTGTDAQKQAYQNAVTNIASKTTTTKKTTTSSSYKVGKTYTIKTGLNIRKGPGTNYAKVKRSKLPSDTKKKTFTGKNAILKKGKKVKCLAVSGNWMKISGGWICCKEGKSVYVK